MSSPDTWLDRLPAKWQTELKTTQLRGKIPIEDLFRFQILRCQATMAEEQIDAIKLLFDMIPDSWRDEEFANAIEKTIVREGHWKPKIIGGVALSADPKNPLIINERGIDLDYDPNYNARTYKIIIDDDEVEHVEEIYEVGGSHQLSPEWKIEETQDWGEVFHACMNLFDRRQLLISKILKEFIPAGRMEETDDGEEGSDNQEG